VKPPDGLGTAGLAAWGRAIRALDGHPDADLLFEAASRYAFACDLAHESRQVWYGLEQPLTVEYPNGIEAPHPLLRIVRDAEADAAKYAIAIGIDAKVMARTRLTWVVLGGVLALAVAGAVYAHRDSRVVHAFFDAATYLDQG
jgi:hypothetical protein